jgi:peptidoglycan/xylan/chitin deacetylase (PgdA/CDA1 family)
VGWAPDRPRWLAKKAARAGVALASLVSGSLFVRKAVSSVSCVRAITYHRFGDAAFDPFTVRLAAFAAQMRWLAERGLLLSLDDLEQFLAGRRPARPDSVLVTIDDGGRSLHRFALPVLREYSVPAVAFVTAGLVGKPAQAGVSPEPHLSWGELEAVRAAGVAIGSHSLTHRSLGRMSAEEAREEALRSRELLERRLGGEVRAFAYPFGTRADYGPATGRVLSECGYRCAFHSMHGAIRPGMDPIRLPRIKIEGGEGLWMFQLSSRGAMDAWWGVDYALWRLQQPRREADAASVAGVRARAADRVRTR